jgi:hypothetical protein
MKAKHRPIPSDSKQAVGQFLNELIEIHYPWYDHRVKRYYWFSSVIQWIGLLAGFATSIIAALATPDLLRQYPFIRTFLIVLPALASAVTYIAVQTRLNDLYQLREDGRRSIQNLYYEARGRHAAATTPHADVAIYQDIVKRVDEIEKQQSASFFSLVRINRE